jgi:cobalt transporter subunit CbtB
MQNKASSIAAMRTATISTAISKPLQLATAFLLGMVLLYGAVFVQTSVAHNAAHDVRHAQGFPCH